jgi:tRNA (guanine-N1)-methyltransferase
MVMLAEPVVEAVRSVKRENSRVIYLSPQGEKLTAHKCKELAKCEHLILLAGHYEGIDERALESVVDEEISIGDVVLTNGCLAACVLIDAVARFVPGVVGDAQGVVEDSFEDSLFDWPHYTRPEVFEGKSVPKVLLSGDHEKIQEFRQKKALEKTKNRRFDLYLEHLAQKKRATKEEKEIQLSTCTIEVGDIKKSVQFYKKLFSIRAEYGSVGCATLSLKQFAIELIASSHPQGRGVLFHVEMPKRAFMRCALRAKELGVAVDQNQHRLIAIDPDGYTWEIREIENKEKRNGKTREYSKV